MSHLDRRPGLVDNSESIPHTDSMIKTRQAGRPRIVPDGRAYTVRLDEGTAGAIRQEGGGSLSLGIVRIFARANGATGVGMGTGAGDVEPPPAAGDA